MRLGFTIAAVYALAVGHDDNALLLALLAIAWGLPSRELLRRWLGWDDAIARARAQRSEQLFEGRRDD